MLLYLTLIKLEGAHSVNMMAIAATFDYFIDNHFVEGAQRPVSVIQETPRGGGLDLFPKKISYIPLILTFYVEGIQGE